MFHKEGSKILIITFIFTVAAVLMADLIDVNWIKYGIQAIAVIFLILILQFFRNPKRVTPKNDAHVI